MAELKTRKTGASVDDFLNCVENETRRRDSREILEMMQQITGKEPAMWGPSIVGFGNYHYKYTTGREGDMPVTGFSPRKQSLVLYLMAGSGQYDALLQKLGKHKMGKGCLYINKLSDVDISVLRELITAAVGHIKKQTP